jgi:4'-phosphopantetheinyl transferase
MIEVYLADVGSPLSTLSFQAYLAEMPSAEKEKIIRFHHWEDRQATLFGKMLLQRGLSRYPSLDLCQLQYSRYNKPFLAGVNFNISHTKKCVGCIISDTHCVGIDMEEISKIELKDFRDCFHVSEWADINGAKNKYHAFYSYWTKKEAAVKADGRGLNLLLKNIRAHDTVVRIEQQPWFVTQILFRNDHVVHVATDKEIIPTEINTNILSFHPSA